MKIRVLSRDIEDPSAPLVRNAAPKLHPFEQAREYTRALNAVKMEKIFAKPFVASLDDHSDGVFVMNSFPHSLSLLASGSYNGELIMWNLAERRKVWGTAAHNGFVRGITSNSSGTRMWTCGDDKLIKLWDISQDTSQTYDEERKPLSAIMGDYPFLAIDHHRSENKFVTCGLNVDLWEETRQDPIFSFNWGADTILSVRFNPVEQNVLASTASDRGITLYDIRTRTPLKKVLLNMNSNAVAWNPMEAFNFTVANEDQNLYSFDMRKLNCATNIHKDHVSSVLSVDYSPTGKEFVSGSYDRTIRIFNAVEGHSREVYHTKRMQRVYSVKFSRDARFVLSGSDDTNIRIWKARASEKLDVMVPKEKHASNYREALKKKYQFVPELRRIAKHRHVPKAIYNAQQTKHIMLRSQDKRISNEIKHSKNSETKKKPAYRKKNIVTIQN